MEKDYGKWILALVIIGAAIWYFTGGDLSKLGITTTSGGETQQQKPLIIERQVPTTTVTPSGAALPEGLPIEQLNAKVVNKFTMANVQNGNIEFWVPGSDVSNPNLKPIDEITTGSNGIGNTTNMLLLTQTDYDVWFNGSDTYYDEKIEDWKIVYNPDTGKGFLKIRGQSYYPAVPFGAFVDVDTLPEAQSGVINDTGTDSIAYDESAGTGSMWFKMDIGNANANSELHDVVMCFRDSDGDMEGDEITAFTASYVSGSTAISIPGDLLGYWRDGMGGAGKRCFIIASKLGSSEKARWQFDITVNEANWETGEEFEITFDDLGDYSARQYPSANVKATPETLTIGVQA